MHSAVPETEPWPAGQSWHFLSAVLIFPAGHATQLAAKGGAGDGATSSRRRRRWPWMKVSGQQHPFVNHSAQLRPAPAVLHVKPPSEHFPGAHWPGFPSVYTSQYATQLFCPRVMVDVHSVPASQVRGAAVVAPGAAVVAGVQSAILSKRHVMALRPSSSVFEQRGEVAPAVTAFVYASPHAPAGPLVALWQQVIPVVPPPAPPPVELPHQTAFASSPHWPSVYPGRHTALPCTICKQLVHDSAVQLSASAANAVLPFPHHP